MTQVEKLVERFKKVNSGFKYAELVRLLAHFGYEEQSAGKTSGSRMRFINADKDIISIHRPHPGDEMKSYAIRQVRQALVDRGLI
jgi:hypothetical protein